MAEDYQIDVIIADFASFTRLEIIALGINIVANLKSNPPLGTPVDTGWASANWIPSIGSPVDIDADNKDPQPAEIQSRERVSEKGLNDLLAWDFQDGPIFFTNNVPYIGALNAGHSSQSPPGFVLNAIERGIKDTYSAGASKGARNRRAETARAAKKRPKR